jgi:hypothetical protein
MLLFACLGGVAHAGEVELEVRAGEPGETISRYLYG